MNNQWIEHKGGECPVEPDVFVKVKFREMLSDEGKANIFNWEHLDDEEDIIAYWHTGIPDPHKEWVKIQEGCPMPEDCQRVVFKREGGLQFFSKYYTDGTIETDGGLVSEINRFVLFWRYPHPDPEDV